MKAFVFSLMLIFFCVAAAMGEETLSPLKLAQQQLGEGKFDSAIETLRKLASDEAKSGKSNGLTYYWLAKCYEKKAQQLLSQNRLREAEEEQQTCLTIIRLAVSLEGDNTTFQESLRSAKRDYGVFGLVLDGRIKTAYELDKALAEKVERALKIEKAEQLKLEGDFGNGTNTAQKK